VDGYIIIAVKSGTNKHYYAIFEYDSFKMDDWGDMKDFTELGNKIFSWKEKGYLGPEYEEGYEYSEPYMDDITFDTEEEAYRELLSNILKGW